VTLVTNWGIERGVGFTGFREKLGFGGTQTIMTK
jgi:hypothetical protein